MDDRHRTAKTATAPRKGSFAVLSDLLHVRGSGTPSLRRARSLLATLALTIAVLALTAVPAGADTAEMISVTEVSYASAHVKGKVNASFSFYSFEYSKDPNTEGWTPGPGGEVFGGVDKVVDDNLTGLKGGTRYFVRLTLSGGATVSPEPNPSFTTLAVDPPSIPGSVEASPVFSTSAKVSGKVKRPANTDPAFDLKCHFEYIADAQYKANELASAPLFEGATSVDCAENPIKEADADKDKEVTAQLTGLSPGTAYHLRLVAENAAPGVVTKDAATPFTTAPKVAAPTVLAIDGAGEVKYNSARFTGKVQRPVGTDPALDVNCHFEYITDAQFTANDGAGDPSFTGAQPIDCEQNKLTSAGETTVSAQPGLKPETTYHFRLVAENEGGADAMVAAATFTTPEAEKPVVTIDPVAGGTYTTAHVSGTVALANGHTSAQAAYVQLSTDGGTTWSRYDQSMAFTTPSGQHKDLGSLEPEEGLYVVELDLIGLQPSSTYSFRISATYSNFEYPTNEENGEVAFSPEPNPSIATEPLFAPTAEGLEVTGIGANAAHLSGIVDPHAPAGPLSELGKKAFATHWEFICTPECKDTNGNAIAGTVQGEEGAQTVGGDVKRLDPNTPYEVSLVVSSDGGGETVVGTFNTPLVTPTIKAAPGGSDGKGGYTLQATVNPNGSEVTACEFKWGPSSAELVFSAPCSPPPGDKAQPVTVEAHLTGLNPGAVYHYNLLATNGAGTAESGDQEFRPTLNPAETCPNEQIRSENNSLALPECRAYEVVTPPGKEGFGAVLRAYSGDGGVRYETEAGNIVKSGQNANSLSNHYVATRSATGWQTIPNLNGASGTFKDAPSYVDTTESAVWAYSPDLRSSIWVTHRKDDPAGLNYYLRNPGGTFTLIGSANRPDNIGAINPGAISADLSHLVVWPVATGSANDTPTQWGPGVYDFVGTGVDVPGRVDLDNSGSAVSECPFIVNATAGPANALANMMSADGGTIVFTVNGGCGGANPPTQEIWARVNATTSFDVSASQCHRLDCNAPARATYAGAAKDGSRVFFLTTQQLVDGDTDQTNDLYACDIPTGNPAPIGDANSCASLKEVSGASAGAEVESPLYSDQGFFESNPGVLNVSEDGSTAYFIAKGALAANEDAFGEEAVAGDRNLYVWRTDAAHQAGQTAFLARLGSNDISSAQSTPDGRYLLFTTANQLVPTDTDTARDVYRYDADTGRLTRASTNVFGVAGNGDDFDADISGGGAVSDDGQKIVFTAAEQLSPDDGNGEPDAYLWTPARVSLISTGSVGGGVVARTGGRVSDDLAVITPSGRDIYLQVPAALTPADTDDSVDIYDARIGGGFSLAQATSCSGEACQPSPSGQPAAPTPATGQPPAGPGNVKPKHCPKGKVAKGRKCVKKPSKKHSGKKHHGKKSSHQRGGGR